MRPDSTENNVSSVFSLWLRCLCILTPSVPIHCLHSPVAVLYCLMTWHFNEAGMNSKSFWKILLFSLLLKSLWRTFQVSFDIFSVLVTFDSCEIAAEIYSLQMNKSESHHSPGVCVYVTSRNCLQHVQGPLLFCLLFRLFTGIFLWRSRQQVMQLGTAHL